LFELRIAACARGSTEEPPPPEEVAPATLQRLRNQKVNAAAQSLIADGFTRRIQGRRTDAARSKTKIKRGKTKTERRSKRCPNAEQVSCNIVAAEVYCAFERRSVSTASSKTVVALQAVRLA
jgi:hypothetical protein